MSNLTAHLSDAELIFFLDGESSPEQAGRAAQHLAACEPCSKRRAELESVSSAVTHLHRGRLDFSDRAGAEQRLREKLHTGAPAPSLAGWLPRVPPLLWTSILAILLVAIAVLGKPSLSDVATSYFAAQSKPDSTLTPGAARPVLLVDLCRAVVDDDDLDPLVSVSMQKAVLREYGIAETRTGAYQIDYLINPQLGGTADMTNLWPQPYGKTVWNAHAKDALEQRLHQMVCNQQIDLATAQHEIASDWIGAYKKYFHSPRPL